MLQLLLLLLRGPDHISSWLAHACCCAILPCLTDVCAPTVASTIATRNDEELTDLFSREADIDLSFFSNNTASQFLSHFWSHGTLQARLSAVAVLTLF